MPAYFEKDGLQLPAPKWKLLMDIFGRRIWQGQFAPPKTKTSCLQLQIWVEQCARLSWARARALGASLICSLRSNNGKIIWNLTLFKFIMLKPFVPFQKVFRSILNCEISSNFQMANRLQMYKGHSKSVFLWGGGGRDLEQWKYNGWIRALREISFLLYTQN